jgi:hypothetical protein
MGNTLDCRSYNDETLNKLSNLTFFKFFGLPSLQLFLFVTLIWQVVKEEKAERGSTKFPVKP